MQQQFGLFRADKQQFQGNRKNDQDDEEKEPPIQLQSKIIEEEELEIVDEKEVKIYQKGPTFGVFFIYRNPRSLKNQTYILGEKAVQYQTFSLKLMLEYKSIEGCGIIALNIHYLDEDHKGLKRLRINCKLNLRKGFFAYISDSEQTFTLEHGILQTISIENSNINRNMDELIIEAEIEILTNAQMDIFSNDFASSGLENPGNTCYMNSLLQIMQHLGEFRKIIFSIEQVDKDGFPASLQELFFNMSDKNNSICRINQLLKSLDWTNEDIWVQQDVQEFFMMFLDALDRKLKIVNQIPQGSTSELLKLFEGKLETTTKCLNVDEISTKIDSFTDIQLEVEGISNLQDSLRKYISEESLEGENLFQSENYGLQTAQKRTIFSELPPVLVFHLKRFTYQVGLMKKIMQKFEFPQNLSMSEFTKNQIDVNYSLYGILTHVGDQINSGHYIAFIRDAKADNWVSFNDYNVKIVTNLEAIEGNYGGQYNTGQWNGFRIVDERKFRRQSAYMLLYVRKDQELNILFPNNIQIPRWLKQQNQIKSQQQSRISELRASLQMYIVDYENIQQMKSPWGILFNIKNPEEVMQILLQYEKLIPLSGTLGDHVMKKQDDKLLLFYRSYENESSNQRAEIIQMFDLYEKYKTTFVKESFQINKCLPIVIRIKQLTCDQSEGVVMFLKVIKLDEIKVLNPIRVQSFIELSSITGQLILDNPECKGTVPYVQDAFGTLHEFLEDSYQLTIDSLFQQWKIFSICTLVFIDKYERNEIFKKYFMNNSDRD